MIKERRGIVIGLAAAALLGACATRTPTEVLRERGDVHFKRGEYAAAAEQYERIVDRYPGDWEALYKLGLSSLETGDVTTARRSLEVAATRRPNDVRVAEAFAEALHRAGDEDQLFAFLRLRAETTRSPDAWLRLARYAIRSGDPDTAQAAVETALAADAGRSVEPYLVAADLAERLGDRDAAMRRLRQAYGIDPSNERVKSRLRAHGEVPGPTIALPPGR